jgi:hypothetical protein
VIIGPPPANPTNESSSPLPSSSSSFSILDWLTQWELEEYADQFLASGLNKKFHLVQLQKGAGGSLPSLKNTLRDIDIKMAPMHALTLLNALNDLS